MNGLLIDTNMLIVLLIGSYSPDLIPKCEKTSDYDENDFIYIKRLIAETRAKIIVTPHILAEVSNLTFRGIIYEPGFSQYVEGLIAILQESQEHHIKKASLMGHTGLLASFGFTDLSVLEAAKELKCAVLTNESSLTTLLIDEKCPTRNMDYIRIAARQ